MKMPKWMSSITRLNRNRKQIYKRKFKSNKRNHENEGE